MKCPRLKCGYEWEPRKPDPKACPMCKAYLPTSPTVPVQHDIDPGFGKHVDPIAAVVTESGESQAVVFTPDESFLLASTADDDHYKIVPFEEA